LWTLALLVRYQRSLLAYESATYNFLNVTHPTENKRDFHA